MSPAAFVISRPLAATRRQVWAAYTDASQLKQWFGPAGVTMQHAEMDLREGGRFHYGQTMPDGGILWGLWIFQSIEDEARLVLLQHFSDAHGGIARNPWQPSWPLTTLSTTTLTEHQDGQGTLLTIAWSPLEASAEEQAVFLAGHASMQAGWSSVLDRLERHLLTS